MISGGDIWGWYLIPNVVVPFVYFWPVICWYFWLRISQVDCSVWGPIVYHIYLWRMTVTDLAILILLIKIYNLHLWFKFPIFNSRPVLLEIAITTVACKAFFLRSGCDLSLSTTPEEKATKVSGGPIGKHQSKFSVCGELAGRRHVREPLQKRDSVRPMKYLLEYHKSGQATWQRLYLISITLVRGYHKLSARE